MVETENPTLQPDSPICCKKVSRTSQPSSRIGPRSDDFAHGYSLPHRPECGSPIDCNNHIFSHKNDGGIMYCCPQTHCNFTTSDHKQLLVHMDQEHRLQRPKACPECIFKCQTDEALQQHVDEHRKQQTAERLIGLFTTEPFSRDLPGDFPQSNPRSTRRHQPEGKTAVGHFEKCIQPSPPLHITPEPPRPDFHIAPIGEHFPGDMCRDFMGSSLAGPQPPQDKIAIGQLEQCIQPLSIGNPPLGNLWEGFGRGKPSSFEPQSPQDKTAVDHLEQCVQPNISQRLTSKPPRLDGYLTTAENSSHLKLIHSQLKPPITGPQPPEDKKAVEQCIQPLSNGRLLSVDLWRDVPQTKPSSHAAQPSRDKTAFGHREECIQPLSNGRLPSVDLQRDIPQTKPTLAGAQPSRDKTAVDQREECIQPNLRPLITFKPQHSDGHITCVICQSTYLSHQGLASHLRFVHGIPKTPISVPQPPQYKATVSNERCVQPNLPQHVTSVGLGSDGQITCIICKIGFKTREGLEFHQNLVHSKLNTSTGHQTPQDGTAASCLGRPAQPNLSQRLNKPSRTDGDITCRICQNRYETLGGLDRHKRLIHRTPKCPICKISISREFIITHVYTKHHCKNCFLCQKCSFATVNQIARRIHEYVLHKVNEFPFACPICRGSSLFPSVRSLLNHTAYRHSDVYSMLMEGY